MTYVPTKEIKIKERQDKFLKAQLEKEREQALLEEIEKTEKERVKKKGLKVLKSSGILDAYQGLLVSLCKYGLPTEDLYEFSALTILKHEKKLKVARKKELEERLKQRNDQKQLNPVKSRAVSMNPALQQPTEATVSPIPNKNRAGSKKTKAIGASSVERPAIGREAPSLTNLADNKAPRTHKRANSKAPKGQAQLNSDLPIDENEDQNPFTIEEDANERKPKKSGKSKKRSNAVDKEPTEGLEADMATAEEQDDAPPRKKKKKRTAVGEAEEVKSSLARETLSGGAESARGATAEGEVPRKKKKKRAREPAAEEENIAVAVEESQEAAAEEEAPPKKKKRSKKPAADDTTK